ncbi:MAG: sigma-54 dependent transcriptional regulator [Candidatus Korobacteraceae bacterium]
MSGSRLLVLDDDDFTREATAVFLARDGYEVIEARNIEECLQQFESGRPDIAILDYFLKDGTALQLFPRLKQIDPDVPIFILTGHATIDIAVRSIQGGADQFLTKPVDLRALAALISKAIENNRTRRSQVAQRATRSRYQRDPFIGNSPTIRRLADEAHKVAASDLPILVHGETGTGKGVLAEWVHQNSPRREEAFVDINCAGLSKELMESELFGHEKGAFTSAISAKVGLLEIAHKGSAFLDEIGDMDLVIQAKLLKVVEDKKFRRLGAIRDRKVDLRLICATHQDLASHIAEKTFRPDLFFRISAAPLRVPPLRERRDDIPLFVAHFIGNLSRDLGRPNLEASPAALHSLQSYHWPGNIRELRNVIERAAIIAEGHTIRPEHLAFQISPAAKGYSDDIWAMSLEQVESMHISKALQAAGGVVDRAAAQLGIAKSTLYSKIKYYQIHVTVDK